MSFNWTEFENSKGNAEYPSRIDNNSSKNSAFLNSESVKFLINCRLAIELLEQHTSAFWLNWSYDHWYRSQQNKALLPTIEPYLAYVTQYLYSYQKYKLIGRRETELHVYKSHQNRKCVANKRKKIWVTIKWQTKNTLQSFSPSNTEIFNTGTV